MSLMLVFRVHLKYTTHRYIDCIDVAVVFGKSMNSNIYVWKIK